MKQKSTYLLIFSIILTLTAVSCISTESSATQDKQEPEWIKNPPSDKAYFVGIAGSKTGIESEDKEISYARALKNLSGAISTEVQSTSTIKIQEESGESQYSYEDNIATNVSQNLENIEIVDTYYSPELGYWYYLRLGQTDWDRVVEERAESLRELVNDLYSDIFRDTYTELQVINISMRAYYEAYSGKNIKMDLLGHTGKNLDSILFSRSRDLMGDLRLIMDETTLPTEITQSVPVNLKGEIELSESTEYKEPGIIPMILKDQNGRVVKEFKTEFDGTFSIDFNDDQQGEMNYTLSMESPFAHIPLDEKTSDLLPQKDFICKVLPYRLSFSMESDWNEGDIEKRTLSFLGEHTNIVISPVSTLPESGKYLSARLSFRQAPPNQYGMTISYVTLYLSLGNDGTEEVIWKSDEFKDGGLTVDQANQRVSEKMFEELRDNESLNEALMKIK